jgi:hypothetical protein
MGAEDRIPGKRSFVGKERKQPILEKEVIAGKELIVTKKAIAHIVRNVASGKSKIVATSAEPARDNPSSNGPEWRPIVPDELAR